MQIEIRNLEETESIGRVIAHILEMGTVVCLDGDLGAGKTTLTQFIARNFGVNEYVTSPTFTIIKEYEGKLPFYHMDVYRIESEEDMYDLGFEEYIYSEGVTIIEWSNNIINMLPENRINIYMQRDHGDARILNITGKGQDYDRLAEELKKHEDTCN
jgi:tRNA threonylcarbamoyladenosine biosynthesis protein TsaE